MEKEGISRGSLWIGHDVWIGANAIITPGCSSVGIGAVIGAGTVVSKDLPSYAIAVGNPAIIIKYRFNQSEIDKLLASQWWKYSFSALKKKDASFYLTLI